MTGCRIPTRLAKSSVGPTWGTSGLISIITQDPLGLHVDLC
jgi:hypothetical protein